MAYTNRFRFAGPSGMGGITPAVKWLLIANVAVFLLTVFSRSMDLLLLSLFGLCPAQVVHSFAVWQLVGYMFLHDTHGFTHILFNMLALWMFGVPIESSLGTQRFLRFYFMCGIGAGLIAVALNYALGDPVTRTIGASGAIYGLLIAFGMMFPDAQMLFFFLFPIKARYFVLITAAILFISTIRDTGGGVSHVAHLGGMAIGYLVLKTGFGMSGGSRSVGRGFHPLDDFNEWYKRWKMERARKKFEVYLRKHGSAPRDDRWRQ